MALARKGRRRLVVGGRAFYWDLRRVGAKPGRVDDAVWLGATTLLRVVSEDKRWRLTVGGERVIVEPPGRRSSLAVEKLPAWEGRSVAITPAMVRALVERFWRDPA